MKTSLNLTKLIICGVIGLTLFTLIISFIGWKNDVVDLDSQYVQKESERTAFYDKMFKIISAKTQIAVKNDDSFKEVVNAQVQGQKNGEQLMMAWVQQSNPTATYSEVSKLYTELGNTIEGQREGFFETEKVLSDIVRQHTNLIKKFPGSLYNIFSGEEVKNYKPIQSTTTSEVMRTGIDDNVKLDLK